MSAQARHGSVNSDTRIHSTSRSSTIMDLNHQPSIINGLQSPQIQDVRSEVTHLNASGRTGVSKDPTEYC